MKNTPLTSILFLSYDLTQTMRNVTMTSLSSIIKYTDEEDYELIWLDVLEEEYGHLGLNMHYIDEVFEFGKRDDRKRIILPVNKESDPGQYACWNKLADMATGDYLCFFQNDVFHTIGRWNEKKRIHSGEADIYHRIPRQLVTNQTTILHIEHGSGYDKKMIMKEKYDSDCIVSST